jgi:hypothetical protein
VYFRLEDGRTVVLGHLSRYAPRIEAAVTAEQDRRNSYEVDFQPEPRSLAFTRGEILAYTGSSGAGPPHLHAEIRTGDEAALALNPARAGWPVVDRLPPTLSRLRVEPARAGTRVDGRLDAAVLPLGGSARAITVRVTGPVRLWVDAEDRAGDGGYRLAPYRVGATLDGRPLSEVVLDRFDWNRAAEVEWTFDAAIARARAERWIRLEAPPGRSSVAQGIGAGEDWVSDLDAGSHPLVVFVEDAAGNRTEASLRLERSTAGGILERKPLTADAWSSKGTYLEFQLKSRSGEAVIAAATAGGDLLEGGWTRLPVPGGAVLQLERPEPASPGLWTFHRQGAGGDSLLGTAIWTGREGPALFFWSRLKSPWIAVGPFRLQVEPGTTYEETWITTRLETSPAAGQAELRPRTGRLLLGPWGTPLREPLIVRWDPADGGSRKGLALYTWDDGRWSFAGADTSDEGVAATVNALETLALFEDRTPPRIQVDLPSPREPRRLTASVRDAGAGVGVQGVRLLLDGKRVIAEWDPEAQRVTGYLRAPLGGGAHEIAVEAVDRVGNRARASRPVPAR